MAVKTEILILGGAAALAAWWIWKRGGLAAAAGDVAGAAAGAVVDMADGIVSGTVEGIGAAVGIPATNMTECERAKAEGRTWDASFACPAGDFLKYVFH